MPKNHPTAHGGSVREGRRKIARPFNPKLALHVVMRSERARGRWSMLARRNRVFIETTLRCVGAKYGVKVYDRANVGNHLHFLVRARRRRDLQGFLREVAGRIAFHVMEARKGLPKAPFWDATAFTRIVNWGGDFRCVASYVLKNQLEAAGFDRAEIDQVFRQYSSRSERITCFIRWLPESVVFPRA